jgi:hypothetical protein
LLDILNAVELVVLRAKLTLLPTALETSGVTTTLVHAPALAAAEEPVFVAASAGALLSEMVVSTHVLFETP